MARKVTRPPKRATTRRGRKGKGGGFYLPPVSPDPDALFTMVLSTHKFLSNNFKNAEIKFSDKKLMRNIITAVENTLSGKKTEQTVPDYNVSADALAGAFIAYTSGDKKGARRLVELAFQSPDCEKLMDSLAALNTAAEGKIPDLISDMDKSATMDAAPMSFDNADMSADPEAINDITGGPTTDADEAHDNENSQTEDRIIQSHKKLLKSFKKMLISEIEVGDDDGMLDDLPYANPSSFALTLRESGKPVPLPDDFVSDNTGTMRLNEVGPMDGIKPVEPDPKLNEVSLISAGEIERLAVTNPELIAMANKVSVTGGKSKKMAVALLEKVIAPAS